MRGAAFVLLLPLLPCTRALGADDMLALQSGLGFHHSGHTVPLFLRYQHRAPIFGIDGYYEAVVGGWNGPNGVGTFGLGRGLRLGFGEHYFAASAGLSYITDTTANLGTPLELNFHLALGRRFDSIDISIGYVHYSNGKYFFGWEGPNYGENFVTLMAGWWF